MSESLPEKPNVRRREDDSLLELVERAAKKQKLDDNSRDAKVLPDFHFSFV